MKDIIRLPEGIAQKQENINVLDYNDNACFGWDLVSTVHPVNTNSNRSSSYPNYKDVLNFHNIEFPVTLQQISKFKRIIIEPFALELVQNKNKLEYNTLRICETKLDKHVNSLMIQCK